MTEMCLPKRGKSKSRVSPRAVYVSIVLFLGLVVGLYFVYQDYEIMLAFLLTVLPPSYSACRWIRHARTLDLINRRAWRDRPINRWRALNRASLVAQRGQIELLSPFSDSSVSPIGAYLP